MDAEALVLAVLDALPTREVRGRKRLQKLAFFAINTGTSASVRFYLHDFGPFSTQVAAATDLLTCVGALDEDEAKFERAKRYYKIYRLADPEIVSEKLATNSLNALRKLNAYSTVELEIASTVLYFTLMGYSNEKAVQATRELKPSKSDPRIVQRAQEALLAVGLYERGRTDQMSGSRSHQL